MFAISITSPGSKRSGVFCGRIPKSSLFPPSLPSQDMSDWVRMAAASALYFAFIVIWVWFVV